MNQIQNIVQELSKNKNEISISDVRDYAKEHKIPKTTIQRSLKLTAEQVDRIFENQKLGLNQTYEIINGTD